MRHKTLLDHLTGFWVMAWVVVALIPAAMLLVMGFCARGPQGFRDVYGLLFP